MFVAANTQKRKCKIKAFSEKGHIPLIDYFLAIVSVLAVLYIIIDYSGIIGRAGRPLSRDLVISFLTIILVIEASRRVIGPALGIIALAFSA